MQDIFSCIAEERSQLFLSWWSSEANAVETQHLTLTEKSKTIACSALHDKNWSWAPILSICLYGQQNAQSPWPFLFASGKMYCAWSMSLYSCYSHLPINIILSLSLHWQITCQVLLHTSARQFSFQTWHLFLQVNWQCLSGRDGVTPGKLGGSCLTSFLLLPRPCSWNSVSPLWCMWFFSCLNLAKIHGAQAWL